MSKTNRIIEKIKAPLGKWISLKASQFIKKITPTSWNTKTKSELKMGSSEKKTLSSITEKTKVASNRFKNIVSLMAKIDTKKMFEILEKPLQEGQIELSKNIKNLMGKIGKSKYKDLPWQEILLQFTQAGGTSLFREASFSWSSSEINPELIIKNYEESAIKSLWNIFIEEVIQIIALCKKLNKQLDNSGFSNQLKKELIFKHILSSNNIYKHISQKSSYKNDSLGPTYTTQMFLIKDSSMRWAQFYLNMGSVEI